jgi:hypothetical protein
VWIHLDSPIRLHRNNFWLTFIFIKRNMRHDHHYHRQNRPFSVIVFLRISDRLLISWWELDRQVFISLDFETVIFTKQGRQPCVQLLTWRTRYAADTKKYKKQARSRNWWRM